MGMLVGWALRFRLLVVAAAAAMLVAGVAVLQKASVDALPEFSPTYAEVQTEALGLSATEVEQLITVPLEADLLNGVEGVDVIRSDSLPGLSSIVMVFAPGTDVYRARQLIEERLTQAHALPNVSRPPTLLPPMSSSNRVLMVGLSSNELSAIEQSVIARWTVRPRLMGVEGVANVAVWGTRDQQLQVQVDPERLRKNGVTLNQVIRTTGNAQVVSPLSFLEASTPGSGGFIETPQQRLQVRHLIEKIADPEELGKVPVDGTDGRLRLADIATIKVDHQPLIGDAVVAGGPGLMLVVEKLPGASTRQVTEGVEDALDTLRPGLAGMRVDTSVHRAATYLDESLRTIGWGLVIGGVLMLIALASVHQRWRALVVIAVTVPLAMVTAGVVLHLLGQTFNVITLAGLAAAVAVVVDEAVVPTDLVHRRLKRLGRLGATAGVGAVIRQVCGEVRRPLTYATIILLLAVVPVAVMAGRPGEFFAPLVWAYVLAVLAAMLIALTVTPALTMMLFSRWTGRDGTSAESHGLLWRGGRLVRERYVHGLRRFSRRLSWGLVAAGVLAVAGIVMLPLLGTTVLPSLHDRDILVRLDSPAGTSSTQMTAMTADVVERLEDVPGVASVGAHIGRSVTGDRVTNVNSSDVWLALDSDADFDTTVAAVSEALASTDDQVSHEIVSASAQSMRDVGALTQGFNEAGDGGLDLLTGAREPIVVRLFGQDPDVLRTQAERVQQMMSGVSGVQDATVDVAPREPTIEIEVDLERAQKFGITPGDVRRAEATLLQGIQVGSVFDEQKVFDVIVQGDASTRGSVADVRRLLIDRPDGGYLRLGQVADVRVVEADSVIRRDAVSRRLDVVAGVDGRNAEDVRADIEDRLATMTFPIEYHAEVLRDSTAEEAGYGRMLGFALAGLVAAYLLLQAAFRSWRLAALVLALLPVSLVGGLFTSLLDGADLSLGSMVGLLAVFGLAVRADVVLIEEIRWRERELGEDSWPDKVLRGARARVAPVVASTVGVAFLALPFAVVGTRPGLEILHPMALALLGGLVTSTFVTLFLLPSLYLHVMRGQVAARVEDDGLMAATAPSDPRLAPSGAQGPEA